jgi:hypothetical protein
VFDGLTRRRPHNIRRDGPPGGIVELHLPLALLTELQTGDPQAHGEWARVIVDIGVQYARRGDQLRDLDANPEARLPGSALRRHTEIRDRTCTFLGCRRRAHTTQQDHTHDYHLGGATVPSNLGPLCPHDHQVKHLGGWRVEQRDPGSFVWRSPLGGVYRTTGEPFLPTMPLPVPADPGPDRDEVFNLEVAGPILCHSAVARAPRQPFGQQLERQSKQQRGRPPARGDPDDPAPF